MTNNVELPLTAAGQDGQTWHLYSFHYASQDGEFVGYLHALDDGHAEQRLQELRHSAVLAGRVVEVVQ